MYERKDGDISIFRNERKEKENQPDYTGSALIDGIEHRISLWVKEGNKGKFFAGRIEPKVERIMPKPADYVNPVVIEPEDDLPF